MTPNLRLAAKEGRRLLAEMDAVVAYLFDNAEEYAPAVASPPPGDAARGQTLVESVGCLGCHVVGDTVRDTTSLARTFGQPLQAVGSKAGYAWLFDWVRAPSRYSPDTLMPSLRLTDTEAADVASYLQTLTAEPAGSAEAAVRGDEQYREIIRRRSPSGCCCCRSAARSCRRFPGRPVRSRTTR